MSFTSKTEVVFLKKTKKQKHVHASIASNFNRWPFVVLQLQISLKGIIFYKEPNKSDGMFPIPMRFKVGKEKEGV